MELGGVGVVCFQMAQQANQAAPGRRTGQSGLENIPQRGASPPPLGPRGALGWLLAGLLWCCAFLPRGSSRHVHSCPGHGRTRLALTPWLPCVPSAWAQEAIAASCSSEFHS